MCGCRALTVLLGRPGLPRLRHALQGVFHHLSGGARGLRRAVSRRWPRGERGARQRVAVRGEVPARGAAMEVEYRPGVEHAEAVWAGVCSAPGR